MLVEHPATGVPDRQPSRVCERARVERHCSVTRGTVAAELDGAAIGCKPANHARWVALRGVEAGEGITRRPRGWSDHSIQRPEAVARDSSQTGYGLAWPRHPRLAIWLITNQDKLHAVRGQVGNGPLFEEVLQF